MGVLFFGSLRWTVGRALSSGHPALWLLGSLLLRSSLVLAGFYAVGQGHWERLVLCTVGFALARLVVVAWCAPATQVEVPDAP